MSNMKNKLFYILIISIGIFFLHTNALAIPNLGVATNGTYYTDGGDCEDYQYVFAFDCSTGGADEGFAIGESGDYIYIWSNITNVDVWLLAEDAFSDNELHLINTVTMTSTPMNSDSGFTGSGGGQIDGYTSTPYWGVNLGSVESNPDYWTEITDSAFSSNGPFYVYTGRLVYEGTLPIGNYLFAAADTDGDGELEDPFEGVGGEITGGEFSPKTTSGVAVPEPGTLLLLGSGLVGLAFYGRRRKK